ncbi:WD40 repeat domain-containing protein [Sphingopyxis sp. BE235]|uniref:WD40 repeat domain-containing protein n=1 Tax=Sphingopyxis sp. BE235 TaxID=2817717 RepID=UPI002860F133|nr:WD40 repeat domain-containing protein [Sphingopyxis sp. BE235]MDR7058516.1 WD40 repeat protein/tetratricopeptide (TPR) repeat protein [Sphingopyxis sp. BE235]MDR7179298.1 WD40 repeat protein/tetratricopeptide (TPR) repeat protein [Sphingopyxis sp. BE249]
MLLFTPSLRRPDGFSSAGMIANLREGASLARWRYLFALALLAGPNAAHADHIAGLSADGQLLLTGDSAGRLSIRSIETGGEVDHVDAAPLRWRGLSASPDAGQVVALGADGQDRLRVLVWRRSTNSVRVFDAPFADGDPSLVVAPVISPGGETMLLRRSSREPGYLLDTADGRILATIGKVGPSPFSPDGNYLLSEAEDGKEVRIHNARTGIEERLLQAPVTIGASQFLDDGAIVVASDNCGILRRRIDGEAEWTRIREADEDCEFSGFAEDGTHVVTAIGTGLGTRQLSVLSLESGQQAYVAVARPFAPVDVNVSAGALLSDVDNRPLVRSLDGQRTLELPVAFANFDNVYRSRLVARGRLLAIGREGPTQIFDLRSGAELLCIDAEIACDVGRLRAAYEVAVRSGRPAGIVEILTSADATEERLGPHWAASRTKLAEAYLALGRRADARSILEAAIAMPNAQGSARARLTLASMLKDDREPVRAMQLVEALLADLERAGASAARTERVLRYDRLRIELGPADIEELGPFLDRIVASKHPAGEVVELDEAQYLELNRLSDVTSLTELETVGFVPGLEITRSRLSLFRLTAETEALRASLLLQRSRGEEALDGPIAALAALDRFSTLVDSILPLTVRVDRLNLRADILRRLGDLQSAVGTRQLALKALEKSETPDPVRVAEVSRAIAEDRLALGATGDAVDDLARAKAALLGKLPDDSLDLLTTIGLAASVDLARQSHTPMLETEVEGAIAAGRKRLASRRSPGAEVDYLSLARLFEAGIDIHWARSRLAPLTAATSKRAANAPVLISPRPEGSIRSLEFSDDGRMLKSREYAREISWDVEGATFASAREPEYGDVPPAFDRNLPIEFGDGHRRARVGLQAISIEDDRTGASRTIQMGGLVEAAALSPDDAKIAVSGLDGKLRLYSTESGALLHQLSGHNGAVVSLAWSPDSDLLASGSAAGAIIVFSAETGGVAAKLSGDASAQGHKAKIRAFGFSPDARSLFTLSSAIGERDGKALRQWDSTTRRLIAQYPADQDSAVMVSGDGRRVAALGSDGIDIFLTSNPDILERSAKIPGGTRLRDATISTSRDVGIVSGLFDGGGTAAFEIGSGKLLWRQDKVDGVLLAADANGSRIAVADIRGDGTFRLLSADSGDELCSAPVKKMTVASGEPVSPFGALAFSADGSEVVGLGMTFAPGSRGEPAVANLARSTRWSAQDCSVVADLGGSAAAQDELAQAEAFGGHASAVAGVIGTTEDPVYAVRFSPGGKQAYALTRQNRLWLYFAGGVRAPRHLATFVAGVSGLAFSPDGARLAVSSENGLWLWNAETGELEGEVGRE